MEGMGVEEIYPGTPWRLRPRQPLLDRPARGEYIPGIVTITRVFADRRQRPRRDPSLEGPGEHLRNALQLLGQLPFAGESVFDAVVARLRRALELLEKRH
jgi:hypothetical protein